MNKDCFLIQRSVRDERGTSLLEVALLAPILLLLALGIIEIGRYADLSILVANAARAGVQYGAQNLVSAADNTGIANAAKNDAQSVGNLSVNYPANAYNGSTYILCGCSGGGTTPGSTCPPASCTPPNQEVVYIEVHTQATFSPLFSYPGLPGSVPVNGKAQMRVAQ